MREGAESREVIESPESFLAEEAGGVELMGQERPSLSRRRFKVILRGFGFLGFFSILCVQSPPPDCPASVMPLASLCSLLWFRIIFTQSEEDKRRERKDGRGGG